MKTIQMLAPGKVPMQNFTSTMLGRSEIGEVLMIVHCPKQALENMHKAVEKVCGASAPIELLRHGSSYVVIFCITSNLKSLNKLLEEKSTEIAGAYLDLIVHG